MASLDVTFSEAIVPGTFTTAALTLTRDGGPNLIDAGVSIVQQDAVMFRVFGLGALTGEDGQYQLTVDATAVRDLVGNLGQGTASSGWIKAEEAPYITAISGVPWPRRAQPVESIVVEFSKALNIDTLTAADLTLTRGGTAVGLGAGIVVTQVGASSYEISGLAAATTPDGHYHLTVDATGVLDLGGTAGLGSALLVWERDQTGPAATGVSLTRLPGSTVVDQVLIQFSEPLATGSLTLADLTLHLVGGPDLLDPGLVVLQPETAAAYRLSGLGSVASAEGGYTLVVNQAGVTDVLGNVGEGLKEFSWQVDDTPPAAVASIRIVPDNCPEFRQDSRGTGRVLRTADSSWNPNAAARTGHGPERLGRGTCVLAGSAPCWARPPSSCRQPTRRFRTGPLGSAGGRPVAFGQPVEWSARGRSIGSLRHRVCVARPVKPAASMKASSSAFEEHQCVETHERDGGGTSMGTQPELVFRSASCTT